MTPSMQTALTNIAGTLNGGHEAIGKAIDAVALSHAHGGKAAFDERVVELRGVVANFFATHDSLKAIVMTAGSVPDAAPQTGPDASLPATVSAPHPGQAPADAQVESDAADQGQKLRATRAGMPRGE